MLRDGIRLFGTDGVRGVANTELTPDFALRLGRAAGSLLDSGHVLVGRDTRRSGEMLSLALQAGFHSAGIDTLDAGILPSGGVSALTVSTDASMGVIVSASHNPAPDNGIKLLGADGFKLSDGQEDRIETAMRESGSARIPVGSGIGTRFAMDDALDTYVSGIADGAAYRFQGLPLAIDCANGAAYRAAPELFQRLGADVEAFADVPDGSNINDGCGATVPSFVAARSEGRIGFAFDGDADRLIAIDENGGIVDGDVVMAIVARHWKAAGRLPKNTVVATVMSNLGFRHAMRESGIDVIETKVGDRYVLEAMRERQVVLGGEQSGHVIFLDRGRTGDGLLTAVRLLEVVAGTGKTLAELSASAMTRFPQVLENVAVSRREALDTDEEIRSEIEAAQAELSSDGRILVRPSGTEPLVRVMVEAPTEADARRYADRIAEVVRARLGQEV
jgi:phosphoglucosamine mutase